MKRRFLLVTALLILGGCVEEMDNGVRVYDSFFATVEEGEDATKAHFEQSAVKWDDKDEIAVYSDTQATPKVFTGNGSGSFAGESVSGSTFYAFFPSSGTRASSTSHYVSFSTPTPAFDKNKVIMPMVASGSGNNLTFKQTCSVLHFFLTASDSYDTITLQGNSGEDIAGAGRVNVSSNNPTFSITGNSSKEIVAQVPSGVNWTTGVDVYFVLPPVHFYSGFTLTAKRGKISLAKSTVKDVSNSRGKMTRYELNLDDLSASYSPPELVDLGLSVKWASANVGATNPWESGNAYAWAEVQPKEDYSWSTYIWANGTSNSLTKYNAHSGYGVVDNKSEMDPEDDVACLWWGKPWHIPTRSEFAELIENCNTEWVTENGWKGLRLTSKKSGYTDKSIFLPAAGHIENKDMAEAGYNAYYWTSSLEAEWFNITAAFAYMNMYGLDLTWCDRCYGRFIRPVYGGPKAKHEYVDLGLSVKWATTNVGATKPEESGDYYSWGETEPKSNYSWPFYKWCTGSYNLLNNYNINSSFGTVDNKTTLDYCDDAARANWGDRWRMPTKAEQDELINDCTWTWTTQNGVNGYRVTSNKSGYKDKSIFLPAAGYRDGASLHNVGSYGIYWSSSLYTDSPSDAFCTYYNTDYIYWLTNDIRCNGHSVRPVYGESKDEHEYVDLGLPSGIKWATTNVGASKPEDYGDYFAWGETEPKTSYSIDNYNYSDSEFNHVTKYCPANQSDFWIGQGSPDGKTVLDPEDDAARANWGGIWRMPTKAEQDELLSYCIWDWTTQGGKNGYRVTGPNDNCIFLPAAGYCNYLGLNNAGSNGFYWCSSLTTDYVPLLAWYLDFNSSNYFAISSYRLFGFTVRPVRE